MERQNSDNIKKFFKYIKKINTEFMAWMGFVDGIFIVITVLVSALPVSEFRGFSSEMFIGLYLSAMMMFFQIRQYLFTGTYEPGLVNADVQNIYAVIKYAPFDEKILRKEKIRILGSFFLKVTAAGAVVQVIKFLAGPDKYCLYDLLWMAVVLFIWPVLTGIIYILCDEKTAGNGYVKKNRQ